MLRLSETAAPEGILQCQGAIMPDVRFYCLQVHPYMQEKYSNAFMGFGPEDKNFALELTKNYGKDSYDLGTGFGHFALALPDVYKACESIKKAGNMPFHPPAMSAVSNR